MQLYDFVLSLHQPPRIIATHVKLYTVDCTANETERVIQHFRLICPVLAHRKIPGSLVLALPVAERYI